MTMLRLAVGSLVARRGRTALTVLALTVSVTFLTAVVALARGVTASLERHAKSAVLQGEVILTRSSAPAGGALNRFIPGGKLFEQEDQTRPPLDDGAIAQLRRDPDVVRVVPQVPFPYPVTARADVLGMHFEIDMPLFAVDDDVLPLIGAQQQADADEQLPIVISRRLLDVYNLGLVPSSSDLPRLAESGLRGLHFEAEMGFSSFMQSRPLGRTTRQRAQIIGFTDQPTLLGATTTMSVARSLLAELDPSTPFPTTYRTVLIFARSDAAAERLAAELKHLGYNATTVTSMLAGVQTSAEAISVLLGGLAMLMFLLALLTVASTMVTATIERTEEIGVLRALGARKSDVLGRFLLEALVVGLLAGVIGCGLGAWAALVVEDLARVLLPETSLLSGSIVILDWVTLALPIGASALVALLGALLPSLRAANVPVVVALRD